MQVPRRQVHFQGVAPLELLLLLLSRVQDPRQHQEILVVVRQETWTVKSWWRLPSAPPMVGVGPRLMRQAPATLENLPYYSTVHQELEILLFALVVKSHVGKYLA